MMQSLNYQVCILGGGTGGMAAAYALRGRGFSVIIVETQPSLGGTATQGWVETWIEGINPPYFIDIFNRLQKEHKAWGNLGNSWLSAKFSNLPGENLTIDASSLSEKYLDDMKVYVDVLLNCRFEKAIISNRLVSSISVTDQSGEEVEIIAKYYIDCSGDGVLCTWEGVPGKDYYFGEDIGNPFNEPLMSGKNGSTSNINEPSLFFQVSKTANTFKDNNEELPIIEEKIVYNYDGYRSGRWVNPMNGLNLSGLSVIKYGGKYVHDAAVKIIPGYWNFIQEQIRARLSDGCPLYGFKEEDLSYSYSGCYAPMLGIRESYRINCDKMLNQNDLTILINHLKPGRNIACGSHTVDFHIYGSLDSKEVALFNKSDIRPSGTPYDCLIPNGLIMFWLPAGPMVQAISLWQPEE